MHEILSSAKSPWIYLSSLSGHWIKNMKAIQAYLNKRQDRRLAWNPGSEQIRSKSAVIRKLIRRTDVLIVNEDEALELLLRWGRSIPRPGPAKLAKMLYMLIGFVSYYFNYDTLPYWLFVCNNSKCFLLCF